LLLFYDAAGTAIGVKGHCYHIAMPRGTLSESRSDHSQRVNGLRLLQRLASSNLATFGGLRHLLISFLPSLLTALEEPRARETYSVNPVQALAAATSRGLDVVTPLFNIISSNSSAAFHEHEDALHCVTACITLVEHLCKNLGDVNDPEQHRRRQVELAVAVKSAGALANARMQLAAYHVSLTLPKGCGGCSVLLPPQHLIVTPGAGGGVNPCMVNCQTWNNLYMHMWRPQNCVCTSQMT
jgi:hypothetical protein